MSIKNKRIVWEHWNTKQQEPEEDLLDIQEEEEDEPYPQGDNQNFAPMFIENIQPQAVITPFGAYPTFSMLKPTDRWDCWIGYTNFDITEDIGHLLNGATGVESLRVLGRYTFCIGVGKLFNITDVSQEIQDLIENFFNQKIVSSCVKNIDDSINKAKESLKDKKFWLIYVHEDGNIDYSWSDDSSEHIEAIKRFEKLKSINGGSIFKSGD